MRHKFIFKPITIFWALVAVFVVIVSTILIPAPVLRGYMAFLIPISFVAFFALGLALIILIMKKKAEGLPGLLKKFLLLTGASAVGFFVFALLHNVVSALSGIEEPFFFILAVFVCPLGFLVGAIGTMVLLKKGKRQ